MEITKTVKYFDKNCFSLGTLYLVYFKVADSRFAEGIFVCSKISETENSISLCPIKYFQARCWNCISCIKIDEDTYDIIEKIERLTIDGNYQFDKDGKFIMNALIKEV